MAKDTDKTPAVAGEVIETYPDTLFRVRLENEKEVLAYLSGKMRINRIRVMLGERVMVELNSHDPEEGRARIVKRL